MNARLPSPSALLLVLAAGAGLVPMRAPAQTAGTSKKGAAGAAVTDAPAPAKRRSLDSSSATSFSDTSAARLLQRRTLTLDDASVNTLPELYVAGGSATVITFQVPIAEGGALPGTSKALFLQLAQTDKTIIVLPKADLASPVPLNVSLADGTVLTFQLMSTPSKMDAQVDVILALRKRAADGSVAALKARLSQMQGDLDSCRATAGDAGAGKVASLLLEHSALDTAQAFDRRPLHRATKENRLLVEARWAYRLLGLTYIVLTVENRDPERQWVLDRATVRLSSGGSQQDIPVKAHLTENPTLQPEGAELVVVAFASVAGSRQEFSVTLDEKDGGRSVTLRGLEL